MSRRVLVTGGSGFIARHLIPRLIREGRTVRILDLFAPPDDLPDVEFVQGDVRDRDKVRSALADCTEVYHLAAAHHDVGLTRDTFFDVNVTGTRVLCEALDAAGVREICFTSTVAVYGSGTSPHHENASVNPTTPYGESKLEAEQVLKAWSDLGAGRRVLVLRPSVVFGRANFANMYALIRQIRRGWFLPVGRGTNVKSVVYVENLIDALWHLWMRDEGGFQLYNVVDKPDPTSDEITHLIYQSLGRPRPRVRVPLPLALAAALPFEMVGFLIGRSLPISRFRIRKFVEEETLFEADRLRATGYESSCSIAEGLRRTVSWVVASGESETPRVHLPPARPAGGFATGDIAG